MYLKHETYRRLHELAKDERFAPLFATMHERDGVPREVLEGLADLFLDEFDLSQEDKQRLFLALDLAALAGKAYGGKADKGQQ